MNVLSVPGVSRNLIAGVEETLAELRADAGRPREKQPLRFWVPNSARKQRLRLFASCGSATGTALVAKIPLDPSDAMVERERAVLHDQAPTNVERPILVQHLDRGFVMTWVPDRDFPDALGAGGPMGSPQKFLEQAVDAMLPLHTGGCAGPGDATDIAQAYLGDRLELAGSTALDALTSTWIGPTHGDLGPWNIRWSAADGKLALIDWEDYQPAGITAVDLLNTVLTSALVIFPEYRHRGFDWLGEQMLTVDGPFRVAARAALRRYAHRTQQSAVDLARLIPLSCLWLHHRVQKQGRPADHLFYLPLMHSFLREESRWIGAFDD